MKHIITANLIVIALLTLLFNCKHDDTGPVIVEINATAGVSTYNDVVNELGPPERYYDQATSSNFTPANPPTDCSATYAIYYDNDHLEFFIINKDEVNELRIIGTGYFCIAGLKVGMTDSQVISDLGTPTETKDGEANGWVKSTFYYNIDSVNGDDYYNGSDEDIRTFFVNDLTTAVYIYGTDHKIQYYK